MRSLAHNLVKVGALAFILIASQLAVYGQQSRISGQIFGADRRPLADLHVELLNEVDSVLRRTKTDGVGGYYFAGLSGGRYAVRVRPFGTDYEEQTQEVEINTFVGGRQVSDTQHRDFYLKSRKASERQPGPASVVFAQEVPPDAKKAYDRGISYLDSNRPDLGLTELKAAIALFPTYFVALDRLGVELIKQQQWNDARTYFQRAIAVNQKSANSWYGLAFSSYATGAVGQAVEAAKKAGGLSPDSPDIQLLLGISLRRYKQFNDAEKALLKAKKLAEGKSPDVLWNLALLYAHDIRNYRLAANELEAYLKIRPDHPNAALLRKLISQWRSVA